MAKKKYEFKPDKTGSNLLSKLYLTKKQRLSLLKWALFGLMLLVLSIAQDVVLCRFSLFGATTDLTPCGIFLICLLLDVETASVFSLIAAALYQFSGTAPGYHVIVLITALGIGAAMFRQSFLRRGFSATMLCTGIALLMYEAIVFVICAIIGQAPWGRVGVMLLTTGLTCILIPVLYPIATAISKIGGETWRD